MTKTQGKQLILLAGLFALNASAADTISFNFASSTGTSVASASDPIGAAETAGATGYNFANWNNLLSDWGGNGGAVPSPILDSNGATVTGMTIGFDSPNTWNNGIATTTGDLKLMRNYLDSGAPDSPAVQITAAPYRKFDLVVYADGDGGVGQTLGPYVVRYNTSVTQYASQTEAATNAGNLLRAPVWLKETGNFSGTYTLVDTAASLSVAVAQSGNYMVFPGLKGTINLDPTQTTSVSRAPLNGFQIVKWETGNAIPGADDPTARIALYGGNTTVAANRTIGSVATSVGTYGDLIINPGVTLTLANGDLDMGDIGHWVKGGGSLTSGTSTLTINRDISVGFAYVANSTDVAVNGATLVDNGGAVGLRKTGGGKLRLQSANPYTGATTISQGSIEIGSATAMGASASAVTLNDAGTSFFSTALYLRNGVTLARNIVVANAGAASATSTLGSLEAGTGTFSGTVTLNKSGQVENVAGSALTFSAALSGAGGLTKAGAGSALLSGNNTYTGDTTINGGVLELAAGAKMYNAGYNNTAVVTVNAGSTWRLPDYSYGGVGQLADYRQRRVLNGGTIEVTGNSHTSGQDFTVNAAGGTFRYTPAGQTLTLTGNGNTDIQLDGPLTIDGAGDIAATGATAIFTGPGALNKNGGGTLTLGADNTYTGVTNVNAGKLLVNGTHTGGGLITVSAGATLGGGGTVGAVTVADSGILAPGNSAGHLTISDLTLNPASVLDFELGAPTLTQSAGSDFITATSSLTLNGILNITPIAGFGTPVSGDKWLIMTSAGGIAGSGLTIGSAPALTIGLSYAVDASNGADVFVTVVPEAGSGVLAVLGLLLLLGRRQTSLPMFRS